MTACCSGLVHAQQAPSVGYMHPSGGRAGSTIDVVLGGYDWTPDMEVLPRHPDVKLQLLGTPGPIVVPEPPYWFGKKARRPPFPLPREIAARWEIPANLSPGIYEWQAANANGATNVGRFAVSDGLEVVELRDGTAPQVLAELPVTVSGQIMKIEEVDEYRFIAPRTGPMTLRCVAIALGSPLNAVVEVRDAEGRLLADAADTQGRDLLLSFAAEAAMQYNVRLYDVDFRGDRSFVYRLSLEAAPAVLAAIPAAGQRGTTQQVELLGYGLASGDARQLESVVRQVTFPSDTEFDEFRHEWPTDFGTAFYCFPLSDVQEQEVASAQSTVVDLTVPCAVTAAFAQRYAVHRYRFTAVKGQLLNIDARGVARHGAVDVALQLLAADGKVLEQLDDSSAGTQASFEWKVPEDGQYVLAVRDVSGSGDPRLAVYRLQLSPALPNFALSGPQSINVPLGGSAKLTIKAQRRGGFSGPIHVGLGSLPPGVQIAGETTIAEGVNELSLELTVAADAGTASGLLRLKGEAMVDEQLLAQSLDPVLVAVTMKPPVTIDAEGKDDVTKWPRGSTFPAPVLIQRQAGFQGEVRLEMASQQGRHRQGIRGPELVVPADVQRVLYPVFLPEWLETTRTSRMVLNGVVQVADPLGRVRYLMTRLQTRIGFLPTGALLKVDCPLDEIEIAEGQSFEIPLEISRSTSLTEPAQVELVSDARHALQIAAKPIVVSADRSDAVLRATVVGRAVMPELQNVNTESQRVTVRVTVLQDGRYEVIAETSVLIAVLPIRR